MKYQQTVDEFMKVAREKYTDRNAYLWQTLFSRLQSILRGDDREYLNQQWEEFFTERAVAGWNEDFLEATINEQHVLDKMTLVKYPYTTGTISAQQAMSQTALYQQQMANKAMQDYQMSVYEKYASGTSDLFGQQLSSTGMNPVSKTGLVK